MTPRVVMKRDAETMIIISDKTDLTHPAIVPCYVPPHRSIVIPLPFVHLELVLSPSLILLKKWPRRSWIKQVVCQLITKNGKKCWIDLISRPLLLRKSMYVRRTHEQDLCLYLHVLTVYVSCSRPHTQFPHTISCWANLGCNWAGSWCLLWKTYL